MKATALAIALLATLVGAFFPKGPPPGGYSPPAGGYPPPGYYPPTQPFPGSPYPTPTRPPSSSATQGGSSPTAPPSADATTTDPTSSRTSADKQDATGDSGYQFAALVQPVNPPQGDKEPWKIKTVSGNGVPVCDDIRMGKSILKWYTFDAGVLDWTDKCDYWTTGDGVDRVEHDAVLKTPGNLRFAGFLGTDETPTFEGRIPCLLNTGPNSNVEGEDGLFCCEDLAHYAFIGQPEEWIECEYVQ